MKKITHVRQDKTFLLKNKLSILKYVPNIKGKKNNPSPWLTVESHADFTYSSKLTEKATSEIPNAGQ